MVYTTRDNTSEQQRNNSKDKTASMQFTDNRPTTALQLKQQTLMVSSPKVVAERVAINTMNTSAVQQQKIIQRAPEPNAAPIQCNKGERDAERAKSNRKKEWAKRRDNKASGKSAGPLSVVAESRTLKPYTKKEIAKLGQTGYLSPHKVRTAQDTAKEHFENGKSVRQTGKEIETSRKDGEEVAIEPITVFERDGKLYTLDHRRLVSHRLAKTPIKYKMTDSNKGEKDFERKFSSKDDGMSMKVVPTESIPYEIEEDDSSAYGEIENEQSDGEEYSDYDEYSDNDAFEEFDSYDDDY